MVQGQNSAARSPAEPPLPPTAAWRVVEACGAGAKELAAPVERGPVREWLHGIVAEIPRHGGEGLDDLALSLSESLRDGR